VIVFFVYVAARIGRESEMSMWSYL